MVIEAYERDPEYSVRVWYSERHAVYKAALCFRTVSLIVVTGETPRVARDNLSEVASRLRAFFDTVDPGG